jgi:hypothetical protein
VPGDDHDEAVRTGRADPAEVHGAPFPAARTQSNGPDRRGALGRPTPPDDEPADESEGDGDGA